jgi:hypothetical protein
MNSKFQIPDSKWGLDLDPGIWNLESSTRA